MFKYNPAIFFLPVGMPVEVCQFETFNASCPTGEVIVMETARYGRMRDGRCIKKLYEMGCVRNVIEYADFKCSGKNRCRIQVSDIPVEGGVLPCDLDLTSYLEASYRCVQGWQRHYN